MRLHSRAPSESYKARLTKSLSISLLQRETLDPALRKRGDRGDFELRLFLERIRRSKADDDVVLVFTPLSQTGIAPGGSAAPAGG